MCYVKLNQDMISYQGDVVRVPMTAESFGQRTGKDDGLHKTKYEEGPWLYKPRWAVLPGVCGRPYLRIHRLLDEQQAHRPVDLPGGHHAHGGQQLHQSRGRHRLQGNSYFFYHNGALPGGGGYHRSVAVERFHSNADGTFPTIKMTKEGPPGVGNLNPYVMTEAETIAWESGVETEVCSEGG